MTGISVGPSTDSVSRASSRSITTAGGLNVSLTELPRPSGIFCFAYLTHVIARSFLVTPAFFGAGMLSGINASWSFCE